MTYTDPFEYFLMSYGPGLPSFMLLYMVAWSTGSMKHFKFPK